jgi:hypothetical protein
MVLSVSPRAFREKNPSTPPPAEYKPPSLLAQHWRLALAFAILCVAFAAYCFKAPHAPAPRPSLAPPTAVAPDAAAGPHAPGTSTAPQPTPPIYVEEVPEKDSH